MAKTQTQAAEQAAPEKAEEQNSGNYDVRIFGAKSSGTQRATASVNINGAFAIRGVKVLESSKGLFVAMPQYILKRNKTSRRDHMSRILFICHGNICRSPMAEFIMKDLVSKAGLSKQFEIFSAATSTEEIGNPVYPPVRKLLAEHGIDCAGKTARQLTNIDYDRFDLLIGMDQENLRNMYRICGGDYADKLHLLLEYAGRQSDIPDPWYTRDFNATWQAVEAGCRGLLEQLRKNTDGNKQAKSLYCH